MDVFIAWLGANFEFDLRRIVCLCTLRQLGLTIITISIGLSRLAFFHLLAHALLIIVPSRGWKSLNIWDQL